MQSTRATWCEPARACKHLINTSRAGELNPKSWMGSLGHFSTSLDAVLNQLFVKEVGEVAEVVVSAMFHRCAAMSACLSTNAGVYSAPSPCPMTNGWSIDHGETHSSGILSKTHESHKHLVLVIEPRALRQPGPATNSLDRSRVFFERADTTGRRSQEPPKTKQPGAAPFGCKGTSRRGEIYFQKGTKMLTVLWWCHPCARNPCLRPTRHWLSMKKFHCGSALIGGQANTVTP